MPFITRFSRLIKADAHAILDHLEEPEVLLRQAVRDMEEELVHTAECIRREEAQLEHLQHQSNEIQALMHRFEEEISICFHAQKEGLARNFIRRKLESQTLLSQISTQCDRKDKQLKEMRKQVNGQQAHYESMRQKSELLWQDLQLQKGHTQEPRSPSTRTALEDDVEINFLKEKQRYDEECKDTNHENA